MILTTVNLTIQLIDSKGLTYEQLLTKTDEEVEILLSDPDQKSDQRHQDLVSFFPFVESELKRTGVNRWILWGENRQKHPDGYSYSQFCESFNQWRIGLS